MDTYHSAGSGWANVSNTPWRMYKHYTHEGGISTPAIFHWPQGLRRRGEIEAQPAHLVDLAPTFLALSGATDSGPLAPAGTSLLPLFHGQSLPSRALCFEHEGNRAVVDGSWKLTRQKGGAWQLYDLGRDRTELHDLAARHPEITARLERAWDAWARENQVLPEPADYGVGYLKPRAP